MLERNMLPPREVYLTTIDGVRFLALPTALPGALATLVLAYGSATAQRPAWHGAPRWALTAAWALLLQAAYLIHTVGHIESARRVGAGMNDVLLTWGLQSTLYLNEDVTARQNIGRALGGPLASSAATVSALPLYALLSRVPVLGELAEVWLWVNALNVVISLLPTPHFDGASLLKWSVAARTGEEALGAEAVQQAGSVVVAGLFGAMLFFAVRGQWRAALVALLTGSAAAGDLFVLKGRLPQ